MKSLSCLLLLAVLAGSSYGGIFGRYCTSPRGHWRLRQDIDLDWPEAMVAFQEAFGNPNNPGFAQRVQLGIDPGSFVATSDTTWQTSTSDSPFGPFTELLELDGVGPTCVKESSTVTLSFGTTNIEPFAGIERDWSTGQVYFVFGVEECTAAIATSNNFICNENLPFSMLTNAKRYACMINNYAAADPAAICGCLVAGDQTGPPCPE